MDDAVDQIMGRSTDEKGADKANAVRKSQQKDRQALAKDIEANQKTISQLNDEAAPIRAENRKVEAEVGPIKYIAAFVYGANPDSSILERAVTWIIILIVIVFDPLAVIMLLASQMTFEWTKRQKEEQDHPTIAELDTFVGEKPAAYEQDDGPLTDAQIEQLTDPEAHISESELDKWNKMVEEAEKAVIQKNIQEEAEVKTNTLLSDVLKDGPNIPYGMTGIKPVDDEIITKESEIPDLSEMRVNPSTFELEFDSNVNSKKKTYMIKDELGQIQTKTKE